MKKGIAVAGPSGSGKGTLCNILLVYFEILELSISATTREPRGTEKDKKDYFFLALPDFLKKMQEDYFLEHEEVYPGKYYGTINHIVEAIWEKGNVVLFDVDVDGALRIKEKLGDDVITIFIHPVTLENLRQRLIVRGTETPEQIEDRMSRAPSELAKAQYFDLIVKNGEGQLEDAATEIKAIAEYFLQLV